MRRGPGKDGVSRYFGMLYGRPAAVEQASIVKLSFLFLTHTYTLSLILSFLISYFLCLTWHNHMTSPLRPLRNPDLLFRCELRYRRELKLLEMRRSPAEEKGFRREEKGKEIL